MNVYQSIDEIQYEKCFLCRPIPNKFYNYIYFYKISYNVLSFTLNTLLIWIETKQYTLKEQAGQYVLSYHMDPIFMEKMILFEKNLLERFNQTIQKKIHYPSYDAKQILYHKNKLDTEKVKLFFRISGIWESETHIGITSKVDLYPST